MKKSIWAVMAGVLCVLIITTLVDLILHAAGVYPGAGQPLDDAAALLATTYRLVIGIAAGWITARLAPVKPVKHALILGIVGVVLASIGLAVTWTMALGPRWYPILLVILAVPQSWLGGWLFQRGRRNPR